MRRNRHTNMNCPIDEMASKGLYVQDKAHRNHGKKLPKCSIFGSGPRWWSSALKFRESKIQRDLSTLMLSSSTKSVQLSNATNTETTMPSAVAAYSVFMFCVYFLSVSCWNEHLSLHVVRVWLRHSHPVLQLQMIHSIICSILLYIGNKYASD